MEPTTAPIRVLFTGQSTYCLQLLQQELGDGFLISQVSCRSAFGRALDDGTADVVLSDTEALGFAHLSLLDHVRAARRPVPVVLFSADERVATAVEAMRRGAADYLLKPHQQFHLAHSLAGAVASPPRDEGRFQRQRGPVCQAAFVQREIHG
jgi:DNA-binding NtrC family response regulator